MEDRKQQLLAIRPEITSAVVSENMSPEEKFQNKTLRPVIKFQKDLLIEVFKNYTRKHKNAFLKLSIEKRLLYIENAVQRDIKFRNSLKGIIIGQFTVEEYVLYTGNSSALNKRMMNLVRDSLQNNIQLLEGDVIYQEA